MERQPLDILMTRFGMANADLVRASTEQLSFKMVQKGRTGREISPNIQEKILRALLTLKPEMKLKTRQLFQYPMADSTVKAITEALGLVAAKKIKYPEFIDLLSEAGILHYSVDVASGRVTFFAAYGQAHVEQSPMVNEGPVGRYGEASLKTAIADAQKGWIDHPTFLKRIHDAGIVSYDVNLRKRRIIYSGESMAYKELIPSSAPVVETPKAPAPKPRPVVAKKVKKAKRSGGAKNSLKARKAARKLRYPRKRA